MVGERDAGHHVTESSRVRLSIVGVIVMALFSALFARLWFLQIGSSGEAAAAASGNRTRMVYEPALRGRILDSQGRVLVDNRISHAITFDRHKEFEKGERSAVIERLAGLLGLTTKQIEKRLRDPRLSPFAPIPVAVDAPLETITYLREHLEQFPGVSADRLAVRDYPHGRLASHVLGYVGEINEDELEAMQGEGYRQGDKVGKAGVEQMFESELRGRPRVERLEVDSRGRVVRAVEERPAEPGKDIQLTIDLDAQMIAEESLRQGMEGARDIRDVGQSQRFQTYQAGAGTVIVLDPRDGSVVAMASAPDFDPAEFNEGIPVPRLEELQSEESNFPLLNRAVQGQYAPGSTFKLLTAIAGLKAGVIMPETSIYDGGCIEVSDREFCNAGKKEHGTVDLPRAVTVSSDVYFYEIGRDLWQFFNDEKRDVGYAIQDTAREYGLGEVTGIGLAGESAGRIPDEQFKKEFNASNTDIESRRINSIWLPGDSMNLAVGQGDLLVTPLQLANAYSTFSNGGTRYTPRLAKAVLRPGTGDSEASLEVVRELSPQPAGKVDLEPEVRDPIMAGLIGVVDNGGGTANDAFAGFEYGAVAGKTGTAEVVGKQDTSVFVGITPVDQPQYVTLAIVEEAGFGSSVAAPIVRRIIERLTGATEPDPVRVSPPDNDVD
jgi:penicillin-binding protein 2